MHAFVHSLSDVAHPVSSNVVVACRCFCCMKLLCAQALANADLGKHCRDFLLTIYVLEHHQASRRLSCACWFCPTQAIVTCQHFSWAPEVCVGHTANTEFQRYCWCKCRTTTSTLISLFHIEWTSGWQGFKSLKRFVSDQPIACHVTSELMSYVRWRGCTPPGNVPKRNGAMDRQLVVPDPYLQGRINYLGAGSPNSPISSRGSAKSLILG